MNEVATTVKESAHKEKIASINRETKVKTSGISVAEEIIQDGIKQLHNFLAKRSSNREQIQQAQSLIEIGLKRKMDDLEEKKEKPTQQFRNK